MEFFRNVVEKSVAVVSYVFQSMTSLMPQWMITVASWVGAGTSLLALVLYQNQDKMLYHPTLPEIGREPAKNPEKYRNPLEWDMPYEDVQIVTSDGLRLHCWFINQPQPKESATIVFFHENAGNMGLRLPSMFSLWSSLNVNIMMVSYRGYGQSDGTPSEKGLNLDADAVLEHVVQRPDVDPSRIILLGRSLGGAVAVHASERHPEKVKGLIVENSFTSIADMVDVLMPLIAPLKWIVLRIGWFSVKKIENITTPILFISGQRDELVPKEQMRKLYDSAAKSIYKEWYPVANGRHNDTCMVDPVAYSQAVGAWLRKIGAA